jgi:hypothetical protein
MTEVSRSWSDLWSRLSLRNLDNMDAHEGEAEPLRKDLADPENLLKALPGRLPGAAAFSSPLSATLRERYEREISRSDSRDIGSKRPGSTGG